MMSLKWDLQKVFSFLSFSCLPFYAGWVFLFLFYFLPKKRRMYKVSRIKFFFLPSERSERREEKLILPKSGLCSSAFFLVCSHFAASCNSLDEFLFFLHLSLAHSMQLCRRRRRLLSGSFCSMINIIERILKFSANYNVRLPKDVSAAGAEVQLHPCRNICMVLWFYNSLLLKNISKLTRIRSQISGWWR